MQGLFSCGRRGRLPRSGGFAMRFLAATALAAAVFPAAAWGQQATIVQRDVPLGSTRSLASGSAPERFDLVGLHWQGTGTVRFRVRSVGGSWSEWVTAAPEAEDQPDAGTAERAKHAALAARQPVVGRRVRPHRVPEVRTDHPAACVLRPEPVRRDPSASAPEGRCAADRLPRGLGRGRVDPARGAPLRAERPRRRRPSHRRLERLHGGGVGGDRPRDPRLPRQGQRLERHRLQLPRRQVRQGLRGPLRRHRPERHRGARGGVQHRLRRRRRAR